MGDVRGVGAALSRLRVGHRAWFWWCDAAVPPLRVSPLRSDPGADALRGQIEAAAVPSSALQVSGLLSVGADGRITLGGGEVSASLLWQLARWAREALSAHPGIARLAGAKAVTVTNGQVAAVHEDAALWEDFPAAAAPGSVAHALARLQSLPTGRDAWFWASPVGPGGEPALALSAVRKDLDGAALARQVVELRRQRPTAAPEVQGLLRRIERGALVFTSSAPIATSRRVLGALLSTPLVEVLQGAQAVEVRDGALVAAADLERPGEEAAQQALVLRSLRPDGTCAFWFTEADSAGGPLLLLADDMRALRPLVEARRGDGRAVRGVIASSPRGWLHFQARRAYPDFIPALAGWTARHLTASPDLRRLVGARFTQHDDDGEIIDRQRDAAAWAAIA